MATKRPPTENREPLHIPRRATAQREDTLADTRPLSEWRHLHAYVLLGDPGAGKSESFKQEAQACEAVRILASDVFDGVAPTLEAHSTVFIDGLDEIRAGTVDGITPLRAIRRWLHQQGQPRFRISCREADWLGDVDRESLDRVAPGESVEVLHLEPLQKNEVQEILKDRAAEVPDPKAFWDKAARLGLEALFGNPLLLDLTIKARIELGDSEGWTRRDIYEAACRQLASESSLVHKARRPPGPGSIDRLLDDAGMLCAMLLLGNKQAWTQTEDPGNSTIELPSLPETLPLYDARAALASKVFSTHAGSSSPRHRTIAEFLAAKAVAKRIDSGLPVGRVLALMQGFDGKPVEPMRGLFAWLAVHHPASRARMIPLDPLGLVLNGDVAALSTQERLRLLNALGEEAQKNPWFRRNAWVSHPFGALATADMVSTYDDLLRKTERDDAHQVFMGCVFDALRHGERMPALQPSLEHWVEDPTAWAGNRTAAYEAWKHHVPAGHQVLKQREWLNRLHSLAVDGDERLMGLLLTDLYPNNLGPREVLQYLRPSRRNLISDYSGFWRHDLLQQSSPQDIEDLANAWVDQKPDTRASDDSHEVRALSVDLLAAVLAHAGDRASTLRLYDWLGICLDEYGLSTLTDEPRKEIPQWLEERSERIKELMALGYSSITPNERGDRPFWMAEQRLHGARRPQDWFHWLLERAAATSDVEFAKYCFFQVAHEVVRSPMGQNVPTMEEVENWVEQKATQTPEVREWLEYAWSSKPEDWHAELRRNQLKHKAKQFQAEEERRLALEPLMAGLPRGEIPDHLMHDIARAHEQGFMNIRGDTPLERVQSLLVSDKPTAELALQGLDRVLDRENLPSVQDILALARKGRYHLIRPAALLAANRAFERATDAPLRWPTELAQKLVAFYLTDGTGKMPAWYRQLAKHRTELVAPVLVDHALPELKKHKGSSNTTGLWALGHEDDHKALARAAVPALLKGFPLRSNEESRRVLNRSLLTALPLIEEDRAKEIIRLKLEQPGLDAAQRIAWLVADLPYRPEAAKELAHWIGKNERRAVELGVALANQGSLARVGDSLSPEAVAQLIKVLAPITPHESRSGSGWVNAARERQRTVSGLFNLLSANPTGEAGAALRSLAASDALGTWTDEMRYHTIAQQSSARESVFKAAEPRQIALTLANLEPANPADLQALAMQHLADVEKDLRGLDTHLVRSFWQKGESRPKPQDENFCRDLLLDRLRLRLQPVNVLATSESRAAADKRADIQLEYMRAGQRMSLPIEIKKEGNESLWTAWREQLQRLYTINPSSDGYGIYLVLWFGEKPRSTPEGLKPQNAQELHEFLVARVPESDRHRLAVQVLDLSLPQD